MKKKFGFKQYFKPTPKRIRAFGDSLLAAANAGGALVVLSGNPVVGTVIMVVGVIGKFISNFFTDEPDKDSVEDTNTGQQ